jgi:hypothetical protein
MFRSAKTVDIVVLLISMNFSMMSTPASANMNEVTSLLLKVCLAGGTSSQVEG